MTWLVYENAPAVARAAPWSLDLNSVRVNPAKHWSGRRESNPRMKLGKLFLSHFAAPHAASELEKIIENKSVFAL